VKTRRFARFIAVVLVLAVALPVQAVAAPKGPKGSSSSSASVITAPFPDGRFNRACDRTATTALYEQCDPFGGWQEDGSVNAFDRVASPQFGKYPQVRENNAWTRAEVMGVVTLTEPVAALPVEVTFNVVEASAEIDGMRPAGLSPNTSAAGGLVVDLPGLPEISQTVIDSFADTSEPEAFSGEIVVREVLTNVPAGPLTVWAGIGGRARVGQGDAATATLVLDARVTSIKIGADPAPAPTPTTTESPSPSPSPSSSPGTIVTYTAPFEPGSTIEYGRWLILDAPEDKHAVTSDPSTGEVGLHLTAIGAPILPGSQTGAGWFRVPHFVPRSSTITVTAIWDVPLATSIHNNPNVYGAPSYAYAGASLSVMGADGSYLGDADFQKKTFFDDLNGSLFVRDGELELTVTLPAVQGDIVAHTGAWGSVYSRAGLSRFEVGAQLRSITVSY
jgi:hypothetical protein